MNALSLSRREALSLVAACPLAPNRNRLLPISISLKVPNSGKPDFGGGRDGGEPRVMNLWDAIELFHTLYRTAASRV
jgi:hypothetical protein